MSKRHTPIDYETRATPRHMTADGVPVFCAYDAIVPLEKLRPNPRNPNHHSADQIKRLSGIIQATGWRNPITVSNLSGLIVKGHGRMEAAAWGNLSEAPVEYQDYDSEEEEWADLIADNRLAELSTLNTGELLEMVNEIDTGVVPLEMTGYTTEDIEAIIAAMGGEGDAEDDGADDVGDISKGYIPMTKPGDIWHIGQHRVMCGSATTLSGGVVLTDGQGGKVYLSSTPPKGKKIRYIRLSEGRSVTLYPENKQTTVWEVARETKTEHPTQKPVEIPLTAIANSSEAGDLVIDFFGGSGSTLIAAEMDGRRCYTMELDPKYCDVIVNRYVKLTGNLGVTLERNGEMLPYGPIKDQNDLENGAE